MTLQRLLSPKGEGRPSCSWAEPAVAPKEGARRDPSDPRLVPATKLSPANSDPAKGQSVPRKGCGGAAAQRSWRAPWHIQMELRISNGYSGFTLPAMTSGSSNMAAGRGAGLQPDQEAFWREIHCTSAQRPWLAGPPSGVTTDLKLQGFPTQTGQAMVQSLHRHQGLPI